MITLWSNSGLGVGHHLGPAESHKIVYLFTSRSNTNKSQINIKVLYHMAMCAPVSRLVWSVEIFFKQNIDSPSSGRVREDPSRCHDVACSRARGATWGVNGTSSHRFLYSQHTVHHSGFGMDTFNSLSKDSKDPADKTVVTYMLWESTLCYLAIELGLRMLPFGMDWDIMYGRLCFLLIPGAILWASPTFDLMLRSLCHFVGVLILDKLSNMRDPCHSPNFSRMISPCRSSPSFVA